MTPEEIELKRKFEAILIKANADVWTMPALECLKITVEYSKEKDAQISDLEKRLKEVSSIAVDLGGK